MIVCRVHPAADLRAMFFVMFAIWPAAIKYGVTVAAIKKKNKLFSEVVFPGTVLQLPEGAVLPTLPGSKRGANPCLQDLITMADECNNASFPRSGKNSLSQCFSDSSCIRVSTHDIL